jgi:hypothetical protein
MEIVLTPDTIDLITIEYNTLNKVYHIKTPKGEYIPTHPQNIRKDVESYVRCKVPQAG